MAAKCKNYLFYFLDVTCKPFGAGGARKAMAKLCSRRRWPASAPAGAAELAGALLEQRAGEATGPTGVFAWGTGTRHKEKGWPRLRLSRTLQAKQQSDQSGAIPYMHQQHFRRHHLAREWRSAMDASVLLASIICGTGGYLIKNFSLQKFETAPTSIE